MPGPVPAAELASTMTGLQSVAAGDAAAAAPAGNPASWAWNSHSAGAVPWFCMPVQTHQVQTPVDAPRPAVKSLLLWATSVWEKVESSAGGGVCPGAWTDAKGSIRSPAAFPLVQTVWVE